MVLLHPLALLGLAALAGPILIHLLMRREAARVPFPTLRFIQATRSASVRRHRLSDWPLLAVRLAVLALAVMALADPVWVRLSRSAAATRVARAIVVDASASMDRRPAAGAPSLRADARSAAEARARSASAATIVEAAGLTYGIRSACDWLARVAPARRELTLVSDFQRGAFDPTALECVPADARIELVKIEGPQDGAAFQGERVIRGDTEGLVIVTPSPTATEVAFVPSGPPPVTPAIEMLGNDEERRAGAAALKAVVDVGVPARAAARRIAIVFAGAPERKDLDRRVTDIAERWMWDLRQRLDRDFPRATRVAADGDRAVVFVEGGAASLATPALIQAALYAQTAFPYGEHETETWPPGNLRALERPGGAPPAELFRNETTGMGRWLWIVVLAALALETWMRRAARVTRPAEESVHERVA